MHSHALSSAPRPGIERRRKSWLAVLLAVLGIGWAIPAEAEPYRTFGRFNELHEQDLRIANVAYRLSVANAALCRHVLAPQLGFVIHSLEQYGLADREEAARRFGLGPHPSVMGVVAGSPAAEAGLKTGDQLISVNRRELIAGAPGPNGHPTRAFVERAQQNLIEEMRKGEVSVRVSRASSIYDLKFAAAVGCPSNVELVPSDEVNAWADGTRVVVSTGLLQRCRADDDLALVIAHELAHNILHHGRRLALGGTPESRRLALMGSGSAQMREAEEEADRLAVRMTKAAAYDLGGAESFLNRLMDWNSGVPLAPTHPKSDRRLALLRAEIAMASGFAMTAKAEPSGAIPGENLQGADASRVSVRPWASRDQ